MFTRGFRAPKAIFRVLEHFLKIFCSGNHPLRDLLRKSSFRAEAKPTFSESVSWTSYVLFEAVAGFHPAKICERMLIIHVYEPKKYFGTILLGKIFWMWFSQNIDDFQKKQKFVSA